MSIQPIQDARESVNMQNELNLMMSSQSSGRKKADWQGKRVVFQNESQISSSIEAIRKNAIDAKTQIAEKEMDLKNEKSIVNEFIGKHSTVLTKLYFFAHPKKKANYQDQLKNKQNAVTIADTQLEETVEQSVDKHIKEIKTLLSYLMEDIHLGMHEINNPSFVARNRGINQHVLHDIQGLLDEVECMLPEKSEALKTNYRIVKQEMEIAEREFEKIVSRETFFRLKEIINDGEIAQAIYRNTSFEMINKKKELEQLIDSQVGMTSPLEEESQKQAVEIEKLIEEIKDQIKELQIKMDRNEALIVSNRADYHAQFSQLVEDDKQELRKFLDKKNKILESAQTKKVKLIKRCFQVFSSRKKMIVEMNSVGTPRQRLEKQLVETPLLIGTPRSANQLHYVKSQFDTWISIGTSRMTKTSDEDAKHLIKQNAAINNLLKRSLIKFDKTPDAMKKTTLKVVYDEKKNIQASALFKIDESRENLDKNGNLQWKSLPLYISYISTAPWNLRIQTDENKDPRSVEGAATALIEAAIYESIKKGTKGAVALESVPAAQDFYKKLGFKETTWKPSEDGLISMELSIEDARAFLASHRAGRAVVDDNIPTTRLI
ncbi:MAG: GNAT family N-acetyltransferase [Parachlamydiaceae bacterium]